MKVLRRAAPHVLGVGDVLEVDGCRERVVSVAAREFVETVPVNRPRSKRHLGTFTVFYAELV